MHTNHYRGLDNLLHSPLQKLSSGLATLPLTHPAIVWPAALAVSPSPRSGLRPRPLYHSQPFSYPPDQYLTRPVTSLFAPSCTPLDSGPSPHHHPTLGLRPHAPLPNIASLANLTRPKFASHYECKDTYLHRRTNFQKGFALLYMLNKYQLALS